MRSWAQNQLVATATLILCQITKAWVVLAVFLLVTLSVQAQSQFILPNKNIEAFGVPPVRASLVGEVQPYTSVDGLPLAGWSPTAPEIWLKGVSSATWISRVKSPGATAESSSIYIQSPGIYDVYIQPQAKYFGVYKGREW
jgi:hypothetical protein